MWHAKRQTRTKKCVFNGGKVSDMELSLSWLQNTAQSLTDVEILSMGNSSIASILRVCNAVNVVSINSSILNKTFWSVFRNNPNLRELRIRDCYFGNIPTELLPANLTQINNMRNLELRNNTSHSKHILSLIAQFPYLRSLRLANGNIREIYTMLPDVCARLIQLDLGYAINFSFDNAHFYDLMRSLKLGLRCLLLPFFECFTEREYQSIAQYHGHSLRCLSIPDGSYITQEMFADLIDSLPHLHALGIRYALLPSVRQKKKIVNPTVTHLLLDLSNCDTNELPNLDGHFSAVTMLSLFTCDAMLVPDLSLLLNMRPLLHTLCVDTDEKTIEQVQAALPKVNVRRSKDIDIFAQEY